jgi:2-isopropylmalate synthase
MEKVTQTQSDVVQIFDTTLRDGEQSPGASMTAEQKVVIARQLEKLGVDVIEAGFAASSDGDFDSVRRVCQEMTRPRVVSLARAQDGDIERALKAVEPAKNPGIHTFIATSDIHLKHKLRMTREQVLEAAVKAVSHARQFTDYIEFSAEDASRSDPEFLIQVFREVIRAGARVINVPDTTGYAIPSEFGALIANLIERTAGGDRVIWSAHCHNDLGLAVANSLAAVHNGARQVECTINGIGERAGNTSLEEVVMALRTRKNYLGLDTHVVSEQLYPTSRLVSQVTGISIPINKPIVGDNAFAHEAGIHQDGMLKDSRTYEIMRPQDVGQTAQQLVLGRHSGRHAVQRRCEMLGFTLTSDELGQVYHAVITMGEHRKSIGDGDLNRIIERMRSGVAVLSH